ncbi:family 43 glycosylhydrolase [Microbacteriaceae bacterium VKM Ac-2854]|nr:family 43 glycosylhydrolase [Microbacteriaceae bacterium VKM Ac-2854]
MQLSEIRVRDPYILTVPEEGAYYLYGTTDVDVWNPPGSGFDCYRSTNLVDWDGPHLAFAPPPLFWADRNFWAPEVHRYNGRYYMFASFFAPDTHRGTQILVSDEPGGPFTEWSDGVVTPQHWDSLDGTLYIDEENQPWLVFCHEWTQIVDGQIVAQRLSADLRETLGEATVLLSASEAPWSQQAEHPSVPPGVSAYVTDGPFLHRLASGALLMLWSSFGNSGYAMGIARSDSGAITGPWIHDPNPLWARDGGHGMVGRSLDGGLFLLFHQPNETPLERPVLRSLVEEGDALSLSGDSTEGVASSMRR